MTAEETFQVILDRLTDRYPDVEAGNMMRSPAITCRGKVFCFLWKERMGFRLGTPDPGQRYGITGWEPLSPFKTKPPLKGWYMIPMGEDVDWNAMADDALANMRRTL